MKNLKEKTCYKCGKSFTGTTGRCDAELCGDCKDEQIREAYLLRRINR